MVAASREDISVTTLCFACQSNWGAVYKHDIMKKRQVTQELPVKHVSLLYIVSKKSDIQKFLWIYSPRSSFQQKWCRSVDIQGYDQGNYKAKLLEEEHTGFHFCLNVVDLVAMKKQITLQKINFYQQINWKAYKEINRRKERQESC